MPRRTDPASDAIVKQWWDGRKVDGRPVTQKYLAVRAVVSSLLRDGREPTDIMWALREVESVTKPLMVEALDKLGLWRSRHVHSGHDFPFPRRGQNVGDGVPEYAGDPDPGSLGR